jgi:hypothetical protein
MKKAGIKGFIAALIFVTAVLAALLSLSGEKREDIKKIADPKPGVRASVYTVTISSEAQETDGITTELLKPRRHQMRVAAYGRVLDPVGINDSRRIYVAAAAGLEKAEAALNASEKEYARMKTLNAKAKNISDRALQAAAAQLAADRADAAGARGELQSAKDEISLNWGTALSGWIFDYSLPLQRVLAAKDVLIQITVPPALPIQGIPKKVRIEPPTGGEVSANFVSRAAAADPKIQGISFIYVAPSRSGRLLPGMDVMAEIPTEQVRTGFLVPLSAVVWLQDRAWVYLKKNETGFSRVEVQTSNPVSGGYFVSGVFSPGDELVIKGAQALLSEESKPKAAGGGEEEDED